MKEPETGKKENTGKSGYSITTWRLHLWCRHPEWLRTTQEFYNRIAEFYYNLLLDHTDLWELGSQQTLRELEIMSIPGRGGRIPSDPLPWQKVPLYFRRAAANEGIASAKSYISRFAQDEKIGRAEKLNAAVTYYKGMYQDFSAKEITLRVWTGDTWTWMHCRLSGRDFPENARLMSPSVVFEYKYDMLHVPVRQNNENTATVRQRMQAGCRILCIQFTNSDAFAAGVVLDGTGQEIAVKFWKGGKEYSHHCRKLLEKIQKSQEATGGRQTGRVDQKYWMHLKHLSEHYGHQVTSQILRFAVEQDVSVIVLVGLYSAIYIALKKSSTIARTTIAGAIINVLVNLALIRFIGLYAASISTLVSYASTALYRRIDIRKYIKIKVNVKNILLNSVAVVFVTLSYYFNITILNVAALVIACIYAVGINWKLIKMFFAEIRKYKKEGN